MTEIKIVKYSEVIDNYGGEESSSKSDIIYSVLTHPDCWSDDMVFYGPNNEVYFIDDLIGKNVFISDIGSFIVKEG
jgi:hypothetical protein